MIVKPGSRKKAKKGEKREKKKRYRPLIFTPELRARLIKLFEKYFFLGIVDFKERDNSREFMNGKGSRKLFITLLHTRE